MIRYAQIVRQLAGVPVARARGFLKELDVRILRTIPGPGGTHVAGEALARALGVTMGLCTERGEYNTVPRSATSHVRHYSTSRLVPMTVGLGPLFLSPGTRNQQVIISRNVGRRFHVIFPQARVTY